jgi:hypothetical protein
MTNLVYSRLKGALKELGTAAAAEPLPHEPLPAAARDDDAFEMTDNGQQAYDFFNLDDNDELGLKDHNVAVYMGNWACKKAKLGADCGTCANIWDNYFPKVFSAEETLVRNKCRVADSFNNPRQFSYCHTLSNTSAKLFEHLVEQFRICMRETLRLTGTKVCSSIIERLIKDSIVREWMLQCCEMECEKKKKLVLRLFVLSKIYLLVRTKNQEFRILKSSKTTLGQLRHA